MTEGGSRLSRWSRMKADARRSGSMRFVVPDEAADPIAEASLPTVEDHDIQSDGADRLTETALEGQAGQDEAAPSEAELDLPDIDSLDAKSDYTPFMSDKVSDAIRNRALRKLWLSDPVLACLDGLNDYDEDYTDAAMVVAGMKSDYVVGRGMVDYEAEEAKKRAAEMSEEADADASGDGVDSAEEPDQAVEPVAEAATDTEAPKDDEKDEEAALISDNETENSKIDELGSVGSRRDAVSVT